MSTDNGKEQNDSTSPKGVSVENIAFLESDPKVKLETKSAKKKSKKKGAIGGDSDDSGNDSGNEVVGGKSGSAATEVFDEEGLGAAFEFVNTKWDPDDLNEGDHVSLPSHTCIRRIKR